MQLESNAITNIFCNKRETIERNHVPADIQKDVLGKNVSKVFSSIRVNVVSNDLHTCHRMKSSGREMVKSKRCRQK